MSGEEVKAFRTRLKLSRAKFGRLIGYSDNLVYRIETGRTKVSEKLEITLNLLLRRDTCKNTTETGNNT